MANKNDETIENVNTETGELTENAVTPNVTGNGFEPQQYITFDQHIPANRVRMFNARNSATSLKNLGDTPIDIVDVMTQIGVRTRSGNPCQNTYIFTADGQVYFTQSNGLGKTINDLVDMVEGDFKTNTTNGYVKVQIKETPLSGDRSYKQFQLLEA
jgi:hypothetical protein